MDNETKRALEELRKENDALRAQVARLADWVDGRRRQLVQLPLDAASRAVIDSRNLVASGVKVAGSGATDGYVPVTVDGRIYKIMTTA